MAKGSIAKELVTKKIVEAFGGAYCGTADKKIYVWAEENGEKIQVAISLTCPKTPIQATQGVEAAEPAATSSPVVSTPVDISPEDKQKVEELKRKLGILI